jgi:hypothetical protein
MLSVDAMTAVTRDEKALAKGKDLVRLFVHIYRQLGKCRKESGTVPHLEK